MRFGHGSLVELKYLRTFVTVADTGGVSAAARLLHTSQPALSRQIRELEHELGLRLFDRVGRRIQLTTAGTEVLARARGLLIDVESLLERAQALRGGQTGILRVGAPAQFMESFVPEFLGAFRRGDPHVDVRLIQDVAPRLLARLERGELHIVVAIGEPADTQRYASRPLCPVSVLCVMSRRHRLARRATLAVADLRAEPMLLLEQGLFARAVLEDACRAEGVSVTAVLESTGPHSLIALARAGHGIAVVPSTLKFDVSAVRVVPLVAQGRPLGRWIVVAWDRRRYLPPYGERFIEQLCAATAKTYPGRRLGMTQAIPRPASDSEPFGRPPRVLHRRRSVGRGVTGTS